ncbi:756_t:CDS:2, partial [Gigaspora rosea]
FTRRHQNNVGGAENRAGKESVSYSITNEDNEDCNPRFLITGTSGVGKSCFLIYLTLRISERLYNSKTWYFVDGTVPIMDVLARTVVSASSKNIKDKKFKEVGSLPIKCLSSDTQDLMLDLSDKAGGVPDTFFSSRLIHRWPDTFWASDRIIDEIQKILKDSKWSNLFLKIQDPDNRSSSREIMFESQVLHLFNLGGQTFESRRLRENKVKSCIIIW